MASWKKIALASEIAQSVSTQSLDVSGSVGIGTASPTSKLSVSVGRGANTGLEILDSADSNNKRIDLRLDADGDGYLSLVNASETTKVQLYSNGVSYFNGGNVGIGTTSPSKKLHIFNGSDGVISNFYGANADGVRLSTYVNDSSGYALIYAYDDNDGGVSDFTKLYIGSNSSGEEIVADGQGRLGIGTTSLSRKFTVVNTTTNTATGYFYTNAVHTGVDTHSVVSIRSDNASSTGDVLHVQGDGTGNLLTLSKDGSDKLTVTHEGNATFGGNVQVKNSGFVFSAGAITIQSGNSTNVVLDAGAGADEFTLSDSALNITVPTTFAG
jgi:hypothetical protein